MVLYKNNPSLKLKTVTTIQGDTEYRRNCKNIKGSFYVMDRDCFFINDKWYRIDSDKIAFDNEIKQWVLKNNTLYQGVIGFEKNIPIMGMFSRNPFNNVNVRYKVDRYYNEGIAINADILIENGYVEDIANNIWYDRKGLSNSDYAQISSIRNARSFTNKAYNVEDNAYEFEEKIRLFNSYSPSIGKDVRRYARFLGTTTWGIEYETSMGNIAENIQYRNGLISCRDGSIGGAEWVTIPMSGAKGLQTISSTCTQLSTRTNIDINCSLHIHLGNIPLDRASLVSYYILAYKIQDEMFTMFPYYKTDPTDVKHKNYCKKLKKLSIHSLKDNSKEGWNAYVDSIYNKIFSFLTEGISPNSEWNRKRGRHPQRQKWQIPTRYYWINFINTLFSNRGTLEFRLHEPTVNSQKVINWLFIVNAFVKYAQNNQKRIFSNSKISIEDVLNYYKNSFNNETAKFLSEYLIAYFNSRKEVFAKDYANGDIVSNHWLVNDKEYEFKYNGVTHLF